jgi:APA family basic amino acid/polyamine antiporter
LPDRRSMPRSVSALAREFGPITSLFITIAYVVGWGWVRRIFDFTGPAPIPENLWVAGIPAVVMALILVGIILVVIMWGYSILVAAMPRSGGGYVAISRILSPSAAFVASWLEFISITASCGVIAVFMLQVTSSLGSSLGVIAPLGFNDVSYFVGGLLVIILTCAIVGLGARITGYALQALVWFPLILGAYVLYLLAAAILNPATLQTGISAYAQSQGFSGVTAESYVKAALTQGLDSASVRSYWAAVSASLIGAYWAYVGFAALTFVAGEVKDPRRNLPKVLIIGSFIVMLMLVIMGAFGAYAAAAVGQVALPNGDKWSFFEAYSYLSWCVSSPCLGLKSAGLPAMVADIPNLASMIALGAGLGHLNILLLIFAVLWIFNDLPAFILVGSRLIFAMSADRLLPFSLSSTAKRFHSPVYATLLVGAFSVFGALSATCLVCNGGSWGFSGAIGDILTGIFANGFFSIDLFDVAFFSLFSLAVVLFPYRMTKTYDAAPFKPGGKLGVVAAGLAGLIANLTIGWLIVTSPLDSYNILSPTPDNLFALGFDVLLAFVGCLVYVYYRYIPRRMSTDYSALLSEIPPD